MNLERPRSPLAKPPFCSPRPAGVSPLRLLDFPLQTELKSLRLRNPGPYTVKVKAMDSLFFGRRPPGQWSAPQHLGEGDAPRVSPGVGRGWAGGCVLGQGSRRHGSLAGSSLLDMLTITAPSCACSRERGPSTRLDLVPQTGLQGPRPNCGGRETAGGPGRAPLPPTSHSAPHPSPAHHTGGVGWYQGSVSHPKSPWGWAGIRVCLPPKVPLGVGWYQGLCLPTKVPLGVGWYQGLSPTQSPPGDGFSSPVRRLSPGKSCWVSLSSAPKPHLLSGPRPHSIPDLTQQETWGSRLRLWA